MELKITGAMVVFQVLIEVATSSCLARKNGERRPLHGRLVYLTPHLRVVSGVRTTFIPPSPSNSATD